MDTVSPAVWAAIVNPIAKKWLSVGAYAIVSGGLVRTSLGFPDGDWIDTNQVPPGDVPDRTMFTQDNIRKILTAVVATKAGLWQMNHQTGQGRMAGYPKKVAALTWQQGEDVLLEELRASMMHTRGGGAL